MKTKAALLVASVLGAVALSLRNRRRRRPRCGDGAGAKYKRVENMHQTRFIEVFLAGREAKTGNMVAACFNTMFTSKGIPASKTPPRRRSSRASTSRR